MILPQKHIKLSESLFAVGAIILSLLKNSKDVDELWEEVQRLICEDKLIFRSHQIKPLFF